MYSLFEQYLEGPYDENSFSDDCSEYIDLYNTWNNPNITLVILKLDRGIHNFEWFGKVLKLRYPNIKELYIEQNYSHIIGNDKWLTFENLFINLDLDLLILNTFQDNIKHILNENIIIDKSYKIDIYNELK
jgi:hypothetical protein